jgi:hypothetical protein
MGTGQVLGRVVLDADLQSMTPRGQWFNVIQVLQYWPARSRQSGRLFVMKAEAKERFRVLLGKLGYCEGQLRMWPQTVVLVRAKETLRPREYKQFESEYSEWRKLHTLIA